MKITSESQYKHCMAELERLLGGLLSETGRGRVDELGEAIQSYELEHYPIPGGPTPYEHARHVFDEWIDVHPLPTEAGSKLQALLARWQRQNFEEKKRTTSAMALGVGEEMGELATSMLAGMAAVGRIQHAVLKAQQEIRGFEDPEKLRAYVADAIADMYVFSIQLCTDLRLDFWTLVSDTAIAVMKKRNWVIDPSGKTFEEIT